MTHDLALNDNKTLIGRVWCKACKLKGKQGEHYIMTAPLKV